MNEENKKRIRERLAEASANLQGKLPPSDKHPKGRNPHAHIPQVIKYLCGESYVDLPDEMFPFIMKIIKHCEENPF